MLSIRLDKKLEMRLSNLALRTGRTKSYYAKKAVEEYVDSVEDYLLAERAIRDDDGTRYALEDVMRHFKIIPRKKARKTPSKKTKKH